MTPSTFRSVPYKPCFCYAIRSIIGDGHRLNYGTKEVCDCATKTGRGIGLLGHYDQATVETLRYKILKKPTDGGGNEGEQEGMIQTEVKQEGMDGHSLDGEHRCYVKVCSPDDVSRLTTGT